MKMMFIYVKVDVNEQLFRSPKVEMPLWYTVFLQIDLNSEEIPTKL